MRFDRTIFGHRLIGFMFADLTQSALQRVPMQSSEISGFLTDYDPRHVSLFRCVIPLHGVECTRWTQKTAFGNVVTA